MNDFWGTHPPKLVLRQDDETVQTILLPIPQKMRIQQVPEFETEKNYLGNVIYEEKFFRFRIDLRFEDLTAEMIDYIYTALAWPKEINFHPDREVDYFAIPVTVEDYEEEDLEDKVFLKAIDITLRGKDRSKTILKGLESLLVIDEDECIMTI